MFYLSPKYVLWVEASDCWGAPGIAAAEAVIRIRIAPGRFTPLCTGWKSSCGLRVHLRTIRYEARARGRVKKSPSGGFAEPKIKWPVDWMRAPVSDSAIPE